MKPLKFYNKQITITISPKNYLIEKDNMCYVGIAPIIMEQVDL
jgi:hypothetical protein